MGWVMPSFAGVLRSHGPRHLGYLSAASLVEDRQQDHASARSQPVCDPSLLPQHMETQFTDLPAKVTRVGLAKILRMLGQ